MDLTKRVTKLVEKKFGKVIEEELKDRITEEHAFFDVNAYVDELFDKYFTEDDIEIIKREIVENQSYDALVNDDESDNSNETDNYSQESLELDAHEFHTLSTEEIIKNLQNNSEEVRIKCLRELEICGEDLINQTSWNIIKKILQNLLEEKGDRKIQILTLKIFQKFLFCTSKPQIVCEAFICLTEIISIHIEMINSENRRNSLEEIYDLKENMWLNQKITPSRQSSLEEHLKVQEFGNPEVLIKSMLLLIKCQKQMPGKWIRFNDKRLREIVFAFIHLLSSTTNLEYEKLSGLELLSILNPTGNWCRHWCHTATGRSLLCSALRKYKNLFIQVVEVILVNMKKRKACRLQSLTDEINVYEISLANNTSKHSLYDVTDVKVERDKENSKNGRGKSVHSAPISQGGKNEIKNQRKSISKYLIERIPKEVAAQAMFCHSMSLVVVLIQFRSGRSLFPVQTTSRKRLLSVHDLVSSMTEYLQNLDYYKVKGVTFTPTYKEHMFEIMKILQSVQNTIQSSRRSADRIHLSPRF